MMRKWLTVAATIVVTAGLALTASNVADGATASCQVTWGSLAKASGRGAPTSITDVRAGRHACYDRLVVDLAPDTAGYGVEYVSSVVTQGKGDVLRLRGGAFLRIVVLAATDDVNTGASTYNPRNPNELAPVTGWHTFRQLAFGGSFEGYTTIGLGVRARLPFRVFALRNPGRLVIDVAHHW